MKKLFITLIAIMAMTQSYSQKSASPYKLNCAPKKGTSNIFTNADTKSKWFKDNESSVGTSWTFFAYETVFNKDGVFLKGDLISPRGGKMNVKENGFIGQFYVLYNEWECEADKR